MSILKSLNGNFESFSCKTVIDSTPNPVFGQLQTRKVVWAGVRTRELHLRTTKLYSEQLGYSSTPKRYMTIHYKEFDQKLDISKLGAFYWGRPVINGCLNHEEAQVSVKTLYNDREREVIGHCFPALQPVCFWVRAWCWIDQRKVVQENGRSRNFLA